MKKSRRRKARRPHNARQTRATRPAPAFATTDHVARLLAAQAHESAICARGMVTIANVLHQVGCLRPYGGTCTCVPELVAETGDGRVHTIAADGTVLPSQSIN